MLLRYLLCQSLDTHWAGSVFSARSVYPFLMQTGKNGGCLTNIYFKQPLFGLCWHSHQECLGFLVPTHCCRGELVGWRVSQTAPMCSPDLLVATKNSHTSESSPKPHPVVTSLLGTLRNALRWWRKNSEQLDSFILFSLKCHEPLTHSLKVFSKMVSLLPKFHIHSISGIWKL